MHPSTTKRTANNHYRHAYDLELKSIDSEGRFAGYASVFNLVDSQRDIIRPGAFRQTLRERGRQIKLLWQHLFSEPVGKIEHIREDAHGLYVEGLLLLDVARAREAHALLKAGAISGLSIGYTPVEFTIDPDTGVRRITRVDLWEISLVTFPANASAQITRVKQRTPDPRWETACRTGHAIEFLDALERAQSALANLLHKQ